MFDFWKEVVINSDTIDGHDRVQVTKGGVLRVLRCADYAIAGIVDGKIYKTEPSVGQKGTISVTNVADAAAGNVLRLVLDLRLVGKTDSSFAQPWSVFKKPVIVESATRDGLLRNLTAIIPADYKYITVKGVTITLGCENMVARVAKVDEVDADGKVVKTTELTTVEGKPAVGTGKWILENLRYPTNANLRYASPNADEMPIADAEYVQYAFEYAAPNRGLHGQGTVGQEMTSVTHHVFYVNKKATATIGVLNAVSGIQVVSANSDILASGYGEPKEGVPAILIHEDEGADS